MYLTMKSHVENLWVVALASTCTPSTAMALAFVFLVSWLFLNVIFWSYPGGSAWGRLRLFSLHRRMNIIPGPRGLPIIGSMDLMSGLAHRNLASAADACGGKRLMALSLGETRAVVTCNPEVAREILSGSSFVDRPPKESAYRLMFNRSMGFAPYGVYWTTLRRIASAHLFCPKQLKANACQRLEIANQVVGVFDSKVARGCDDVVRVRDVLKLASLNNMMWSVFGRRCELDSANPETAELLDLVDEGYGLLGQLNWSDHFSLLADFDVQRVRSRCSRLVPRVNRIVGRIMSEHENHVGDQTKRDFVDVLLSLQGPDRLSESDMISLLWEMIFRGTDTVAVLMEWILARLALHPDVQSRVQEEVDEVAGRTGGAVTESDITELVYLTAVVKEVLRLHPPGPLLSWSRLSIRDAVVGGYHVGGGTTAMVNMWAIGRDPEIWAEPLRFRPERFLGSGSEISVMGSDLRVAPFGSGRRSCPGKTMGMSAVSYWVARIVHEFEIGKSGSVDLSEELRLSCQMANPLLLRLRRRNRNRINQPQPKPV